MRLTPFFPAACLSLMLAFAPDAKPEDKPEGTQVPVSEADTLSPEDLGIGKYVFETKVPYGKVLVLRSTRERGERKDVLETIQHADGKVARQVVLVFDSFDFPYSRGKVDMVRVRGQGNNWVFVDVQRSLTAVGDGRLILEFANLTNDTVEPVKLRYDCFVEDYETTKKRVGRLPAISRGMTWTFNAIINDE